MIFGCNLVAAIIPLLVSRFIHRLSCLLSPLVTGSVIVLIGISLIRVSISDWGGGLGAADFGAPSNLGLGALTLAVIVIMNCSRSPWIRLSGIITGIAAGSVAAWLTGSFHPHFAPGGPLLTLPVPFRFGLDFTLSLFIPVALVSFISIIEAAGDLTANCVLSQQPLTGPEFEQRMKGGILGDGISCLLAAIFSTFPRTTFAQNNGVIQMTRVASRYAGFRIGGIFIVPGLFPEFSHLLEQLPGPVLGGATLVMFGHVIAAGIRVMNREPIDSRGMLIIAIAFGVGLGIEAQPDIIKQLPAFARTLMQNAVTRGGLLAIILNIILPKPANRMDVNTHLLNSDNTRSHGENIADRP